MLVRLVLAAALASLVGVAAPVVAGDGAMQGHGGRGQFSHHGTGHRGHVHHRDPLPPVQPSQRLAPGNYWGTTQPYWNATRPYWGSGGQQGVVVPDPDREILPAE